MSFWFWAGYFSSLNLIYNFFIHKIRVIRLYVSLHNIYDMLIYRVSSWTSNLHFLESVDVEPSLLWLLLVVPCPSFSSSGGAGIFVSRTNSARCPACKRHSLSHDWLDRQMREVLSLWPTRGQHFFWVVLCGLPSRWCFFRIMFWVSAH